MRKKAEINIKDKKEEKVMSFGIAGIEILRGKIADKTLEEGEQRQKILRGSVRWVCGI